MVFHFSSAAHDVSTCGIIDTVAGAAGNVHCFQNVDLRAGHLSVTNKEAGSCQGSKTASYNVSIFIFHAFRFFRAGKSFIISVAVVDASAVFCVFSTLCISVIFICCS